MWIYSPKLALDRSWLTIPAYAIDLGAGYRPRCAAASNEKFERGCRQQLAAGRKHRPACRRSRPPRSSRNGRSGGSGSSPATVAASQNVINLSNTGSQAIQLVSKLSFAAILYFGAGPSDRRRADRRRAGGVQHVRAASLGAGDPASRSCGRISSRCACRSRGWATFSITPAEPGAGHAAPRCLRIKGAVTLRWRALPLPAIDGPWTLDGDRLSRCLAGTGCWASSGRRAPASRRSPSCSSACMCRPQAAS